MNTPQNLPRTLRRSLAVGALMAAPLLLAACSSGPHHAGGIDAIRWDPTPAMHTLAKRDSDRLNSLSYVRDTNLREFSSDLDRALLLDRPSRLYMGVKP